MRRLFLVEFGEDGYNSYNDFKPVYVLAKNFDEAGHKALDHIESLCVENESSIITLDGSLNLQKIDEKKKRIKNIKILSDNIL